MSSRPASAAQIAANRANASHSTGPKTGEGKARVAANRFAHGLVGDKFVLLTWEKRADFDDLLSRLLTEHDPLTPTETILITRMAEHHWLRERALVLQELCFDFDLPNLSDEKQFALYLRYETLHERAFHRCLNEFLKLKKTRRESEIGFEPQNTAAPPPPSPEPENHAAPPVEAATGATEATTRQVGAPSEAIGFTSEEVEAMGAATRYTPEKQKVDPCTAPTNHVATSSGLSGRLQAG